MTLSPILILLGVGYLSVSLNAYLSFKKSGLLNSDNEQSGNYYMYIFFWPAYVNPVKLLATKIFSQYGDTNSIYPGWDSLKNRINDFTKGRNRYKSYIHYTFEFEVDKSPDPNFEKFTHVLVHIAQKDKKLLMLCNFSETRLKNFSFSRFALDRCDPLDHQKIIDKLLSLNVKHQDIEIVAAAIHKKDINNENNRT
jgi:hypothetical protein